MIRTFEAISDAPPIIFPLLKMRQAWGHSPSCEETPVINVATPLCWIPLGLWIPHFLRGSKTDRVSASSTIASYEIVILTLEIWNWGCENWFILVNDQNI